MIIYKLTKLKDIKIPNAIGWCKSEKDKTVYNNPDCTVKSFTEYNLDELVLDTDFKDFERPYLKNDKWENDDDFKYYEKPPEPLPNPLDEIREELGTALDLGIENSEQLDSVAEKVDTSLDLGIENAESVDTAHEKSDASLDLGIENAEQIETLSQTVKQLKKEIEDLKGGK